MITVRFTPDPGPHGPADTLEVLFEASFEAMPRVMEYVLTKTLAVYQITGVVHVVNEDSVAMCFATTRVVRPAPVRPPDI